jgi:hypothetical protein
MQGPIATHRSRAPARVTVCRKHGFTICDIRRGGAGLADQTPRRGSIKADSPFRGSDVPWLRIPGEPVNFQLLLLIPLTRMACSGDAMRGDGERSYHFMTSYLLTPRPGIADIGYVVLSSRCSPLKVDEGLCQWRSIKSLITLTRHGTSDVCGR